MDAPLCPRCGFAVIYWTAGRFPFCAECGWNFDEVHKNLGKNERSTAWIVGALPFLVGALLVRHRANWSAALILFGIAGAIVALVASTRSRGNRRMETMRDTIKRTAGSDLSSKSPAELPAQAATFGESLRSLPRPRPVRLVAQARAAIWMVRVIPLFLAYWALHDLIFPTRPIGMMSGPGTSTILLLLSLFVWFLAPRPLRREPHLPLLTAGEVAMARVTTSSRRFLGAGISFQFRDLEGRLVEGQGANRTEYRLDGTCISVFYDAQNPANCIPICALNYELALPKETPAAVARLERKLHKLI